jgi:hypothetical protein
MRWVRGVIYGVAFLLLAAELVLEGFAAPCPDLIDGPCDSNWSSDLQWNLFPFFLLALAGAVAILAWDVQTRVRRVWREFREDATRTD